MKSYEWNDEKNNELQKERNISFEDIVYQINEGNLIGTIPHPNKERYQNQDIYLVNIDDYIYLVPYVEGEDNIFLKTIIPSRKATKKYLKEKRKEK